MAPRTCLECGFLTIRGREITEGVRTMLGAGGGSAVMPSDGDQTNCFKGLWVAYEITYSRDSIEGVFDELQRSRDTCKGFFQYQPCYTPAAHLTRQEEEQRRSDERGQEKERQALQWRIAKWNVIAGLVGALVGAILGTNLVSIATFLKGVFVHH